MAYKLPDIFLPKKVNNITYNFHIFILLYKMFTPT